MKPMSEIGQTFRNARPMIESLETGPKKRLSRLSSRLSPITKTRPSGTVQLSGLGVESAQLGIGARAVDGVPGSM